MFRSAQIPHLPGMHDGKENLGKVPLTLVLECCGLEDVARAMEHGERAYGRGTWANGVRPASTYLDAAARHLFAYLTGEKLDPESGVSHIAHACASALIYLSKERLGLNARDLTFDERRNRPARALAAAQAYEARATPPARHTTEATA